MTVEEWALVASVVFTGLWSGLFGMLNLVMHPMLAAMNGYDFARFLRAFLPTARHAPFNYVEVIGMVVAPIVALVALGDDPSATPFVLTAIGLVLTVAGPLLVSSRLAEPNYDAMLGWDPEAMPADWRRGAGGTSRSTGFAPSPPGEPSRSSWRRPSTVIPAVTTPRVLLQSVSGNEWCSWATTHRPCSLRSPSVKRKRFSGFSMSSCCVPQRSSA
jgi:hypothetical protein